MSQIDEEASSRNHKTDGIVIIATACVGGAVSVLTALVTDADALIGFTIAGLALLLGIAFLIQGRTGPASAAIGVSLLTAVLFAFQGELEESERAGQRQEQREQGEERALERIEQGVEQDFQKFQECLKKLPAKTCTQRLVK